MVDISLHITPLCSGIFQGFAIAYQLKSKLLLNQSTLRACFQSYLHQLLQNTPLPSQTRLFICPGSTSHFATQCILFLQGPIQMPLSTCMLSFPIPLFPQGCPKVNLISSSCSMFGYFSYGIIYTLPWGRGIYVPVLPLLLPSSLFSPSPCYIVCHQGKVWLSHLCKTYKHSIFNYH